MNCFECGKWQDVVYIVWQWKGCRARSCQCFSFALLMGMHVCSGRMGASINSNLNLSVFTKLSNFDHVFLYWLSFAVHHLGPMLHELDLHHLSRKPTLFTTLFVSWDFVESYFQFDIHLQPSPVLHKDRWNSHIEWFQLILQQRISLLSICAKLSLARQEGVPA